MNELDKLNILTEDILYQLEEDLKDNDFLPKSKPNTDLDPDALAYKSAKNKYNSLSNERNQLKADQEKIKAALYANPNNANVPELNIALAVKKAKYSQAQADASAAWKEKNEKSRSLNSEFNYSESINDLREMDNDLMNEAVALNQLKIDILNKQKDKIKDEISNIKDESKSKIDEFKKDNKKEIQDKKIKDSNQATKILDHLSKTSENKIEDKQNQIDVIQNKIDNTKRKEDAQKINDSLKEKLLKEADELIQSSDELLNESAETRLAKKEEKLMNKIQKIQIKILELIKYKATHNKENSDRINNKIEKLKEKLLKLKEIYEKKFDTNIDVGVENLQEEADDTSLVAPATDVKEEILVTDDTPDYSLNPIFHGQYANILKMLILNINKLSEPEREIYNKVKKSTKVQALSKLIYNKLKEDPEQNLSSFRMKLSREIDSLLK